MPKRPRRHNPSLPKPKSPADTQPRSEAADYMAALQFHRYPDLLSVFGVSQLLGVSRHTVYVLVASGEISAARVGPRGLRVFKSSVIDYIRRGLV